MSMRAESTRRAGVAMMKEEEGKCGKCGQPTHLKAMMTKVGGLAAFPTFPLIFFHLGPTYLSTLCSPLFGERELGGPRVGVPV